MKKNTLAIIGIDVGNFDTKSQHTTIPSGYNGPYMTRPLLERECICLNGQYYALSSDRLYYTQDKTQDERCIVLSLFSIAKEILYKITKSKDVSNEETADHDVVQENISRISHISLGVGLPIAHYRKNDVQKLIAYYNHYMAGGISFDYNEFHFSFTMDVCKVYPQGGAAAASISSSILTKYRTYYIFDLGGYTFDIARFIDGMPQKDVHSLELGIIILYDNIIERVFKDCDISIDYNAIEDVLCDRAHVLESDVVEIVIDMAKRHADKIISALRQAKVAFTSYSCIFVGGGSIVLKKYLMSHPLIRREIIHFIGDTRANAKGYAKLLRSSLHI